MGLAQAVQSLADNLEFPLDRSLRHPILEERFAFHAFGESLNVRPRPRDIRQRNARITFHKRLRVTC